MGADIGQDVRQVRIKLARLKTLSFDDPGRMLDELRGPGTRKAAQRELDATRRDVKDSPHHGHSPDRSLKLLARLPTDIATMLELAQPGCLHNPGFIRAYLAKHPDFVVNRDSKLLRVET